MVYEDGKKQNIFRFVSFPPFILVVHVLCGQVDTGIRLPFILTFYTILQ